MIRPIFSPILGSLARAINESARGRRYLGPSLDLNFATNTYLRGAVDVVPTPQAFASVMTFTRSSEGTFFDSSGNLQTAAVDVPRLTHDPVTLQPLGILIEEQRTNLLLNSATLATQAATVTAAPTTLSFTGTGTVTLTGAISTVLVGLGVSTRVSTTFTPIAGVVTLTVTGSVTRAQLETGASATSYIPTTASQVTRAADVCSVNNLSPWYNALEGAIVVEGVPSDGSGLVRGAASINDGSQNNRIHLRHSGATSGNVAVVSGGVLQVGPSSTPAGTWPAGGRSRLALSYRVNDFAFSCGGSVVQTDTSGTVPAVNRMDIGAGPGAAPFNGTIARLTYYPRVIDVQQASA